MIWDGLNLAEQSKNWNDPTRVTEVLYFFQPFSLLFRVKKCWATSSRCPCTSSSLLSPTCPAPAGRHSPPYPRSGARSESTPQPAAVPRPSARTAAPPRTVQGDCVWPPSRRTPAATLTSARRACQTISQPQEPARRLRNPPTRIWPNRNNQPGTGGAWSGRNASTLKRQSAKMPQWTHNTQCEHTHSEHSVHSEHTTVLFCFWSRITGKRNGRVLNAKCVRSYIIGHSVTANYTLKSGG